jgi:arylsulfatase A-like enzyme
LRKYPNEFHDPNFRTRPGSVIIYGKWKLHEYFENGNLELYNLKKDIGEQHNLAEQMPEKTRKLHAMLKTWRKAVNAPIPTEQNPAYKP